MPTHTVPSTGRTEFSMGKKIPNGVSRLDVQNVSYQRHCRCSLSEDNVYKPYTHSSRPAYEEDRTQMGGLGWESTAWNLLSLWHTTRYSGRHTPVGGMEGTDAARVEWTIYIRGSERIQAGTRLEHDTTWIQNGLIIDSSARIAFIQTRLQCGGDEFELASRRRMGH